MRWRSNVWLTFMSDVGSFPKATPKGNQIQRVSHGADWQCRATVDWISRSFGMNMPSAWRIVVPAGTLGEWHHTKI